MSKNKNTIEERPWGSFEILEDRKGYKLKEIVVNPGHRLSLQSHKKRSETWVIIHGIGEVSLGGQLIDCSPGKVVYIPKGQIHRIANTGKKKLIFVEVQTGTYFGEDDIVRYEDDYDRI